MLDEIAKSISELEDMPNNEDFYEACLLVAENVWELNEEDAIKVADIIQEKYL